MTNDRRFGIRMAYAVPALLALMVPLRGAHAQDQQSAACANVTNAAAEAAIQACTAILQAGGLTPQAAAGIYQNRSIAEVNAHQYDPGIADANTLLQANPNDGNAYVILGLAAFDQNQNQDAVADFTKGIGLQASFADLAYQLRGAAEENSGSPQAAVQDENTALQMNPSNEGALFVRGEAEGDLNQYQQAIQDDTAALNLNPQDEKALVNRGDVYLQESQYPAAISDNTAAIQLNPQDENAFVNRGISEAQSGQNDLAIADATQALRLDGNNAVAYTVRGVAEGNEQNYTQEVADEQAALRINPNLQMAQQSLQQAQQKLSQ